MKKLFMIFLLGALVSCNEENDNKSVADNFVIAYNVMVPDALRENWEIFVTDKEGKHRMNITNNKDIAWAYYAYRDKLYFISDRDSGNRCFFLYETDAEGKNVRKVSDLRLETGWMSSRNNGKEMVVSGRVGAVRNQLFIISLKNGSYRQITNDTSAIFFDPCFSPDGKQIVVSYLPKNRGKFAHEELYLMNADGSGLSQLTHYPQNDTSLHEKGYKAGAARWHPSENFISYVSKQKGITSIYAITPDGRKQWKISSGIMAEGWHDWSADGQWIAYNAADRAESQFHIMLKNYKTGDLIQLTDDKYASQQGPVFLYKK